MTQASQDFRLKVGGLHTLAADLPVFRPTHMIRLVDPELPEEKLRIAAPPEAGLLLVRVSDTTHNDPLGPSHDHVADILGFIDSMLTAGGRQPVRLYVHCHAGVSRSTATAYLTLACRHGAGREADAFTELLGLTEKPWPNRSIVAHADALLGRGGRLLAPLDAYRAAHPRRIDAYLRLHLRRIRLIPGYAELMGMSREQQERWQRRSTRVLRGVQG
jgi:predicted protein tyrosine phosphatase